MYQTHKTFIQPDLKMSELINENHLLLLCLQHLEIDIVVGDKTVDQICRENKIDQSAFILISNLYNGFYPSKSEIQSITGISEILRFLRNSHIFYKEDKYPEISNYIKALNSNQNHTEITLLQKFFDEYFEEVLEHLRYEDEIAFPYFLQLLEEKPAEEMPSFSANEYREHHSDIETKLTDLKNLLLKHLNIEGSRNTLRKLLNSLFELEFDLSIHSLIEEFILLPKIEQVETEMLNG
jgi:regulator of cell morphogenesis and NO signaling